MVKNGRKACGPDSGTQQQTRTCDDGTKDLCTNSEREREISCSMKDCEKELGDWKNSGPCVAEDNGKNCGPGYQRQTRDCTDGTEDKCTLTDRNQQISCVQAGSQLPNCPGICLSPNLYI